jgi:phospholipid/cholesterol/gamma-HCH transport system ATP-binding protein
MIELRHVTYSIAAPEYSDEDDEAQHPARRDGRQYILDNVSFVVPERSITCIMGVSGTGKTTLLRLIAGLLKPDSGEILVNGRDVVLMSEKELNEVRREMGFVFQYGALFDSMSIADNVGFGLQQQRRPRAEIADIVTARLEDVGLPGIQDKMPGELSGGMRKRVAMARALATSPRIVLYDEPTSGLDPVMARVIDDLVVHLRDTAGTTKRGGVASPAVDSAHRRPSTHAAQRAPANRRHADQVQASEDPGRAPVSGCARRGPITVR